MNIMQKFKNTKLVNHKIKLTKTTICCALLAFFLFPKNTLKAQNPRISLNGNDTITVYRNPIYQSCYNESAYTSFTASDPIDGDITNNVIQSSNLNCLVNGWYQIKFKVVNSRGYADSAYRHILVRTAMGVPNAHMIVHPFTYLFHFFGLQNMADSGAYQFEWTATSPSGMIYSSTHFEPSFISDEFGAWRICMRARNTVGWSNWRCTTSYCLFDNHFFIGAMSSTYADTGKLYDNGGALMHYDNNRKPSIDNFTIKHDCIELQLNIEKLRLADTGDRLYVFEGSTPLHPPGGFGPGDITSFPAVFICDSDSVNIRFKSNGSGTDSGFVISWKPAGQEEINGFVYLDLDSNCIYNPSIDLTADDYTVKIKNTVLRVRNNAGRFKVIGDTSQKRITFQSTTNWTAHCPKGGVETWTFKKKDTFEFGLKSGPVKRCDFSTIAVNDIGPVAVRGVKCTMNILSVNNGNIQAGKLNCRIMSSRKLSYIKRTKNTYTATDTSLTFTQNVTHPFFGANTEEIEYMVKPGDTGTVSFTCNCYPDKKDSDSTNNRYKLDLTIVNAFDPNDKLASVADSFYEKPKQIVYRIRFQNTGTWPATDVIVRDTLSPLLDTNTLTLLETSHSCQMERNGYAVAFKFMEIHLQDSNRNEPESHGHIFYSIKPVNQLKHYEPILNTAHIYFDAEKPVITNTTSNQWVLPAINSTKQLQESEFVVYPNPTRDLLNIRSASSALTAYTLTDMQGKVHLKGQFNGAEHTLMTSGLNTGMYFLTIIRHGQLETCRVFVQQHDR